MQIGRGNFSLFSFQSLLNSEVLHQHLKQLSNDAALLSPTHTSRWPANLKLHLIVATQMRLHTQTDTHLAHTHTLGTLISMYVIPYQFTAIAAHASPRLIRLM